MIIMTLDAAVRFVVRLSLLIISHHAFLGQSAPPKIAIVGAGIGGSSCAYYLKQWIPEANITILEADDRIGGRIQEISIDGVVVEVGADAWATSNRYISELAKKLKLPTEQDVHDRYKHPATSLGKDKASTDSLMIWNGNSLVSAFDVISQNLPSAIDILEDVGEFLTRLELNYIERDVDGKPFDDLNQYLKSDGNLWEYVDVSSAKFYDKHGATKSIQTSGIEPILRVIYGQDLNAHAFASLVSLTSVVEQASSVKGGNAQLPKALINASEADVKLSSPVTVVSKYPGGVYHVTYDKGSPQILAVDVVVLAAPLEWTEIKFNGFQIDPTSKQPRRSWTYWYVHHVMAKSLNNVFFHQPQNWNQPLDVLTTKNASTPWATIQYIADEKGLKIYKLFCFQNLTSTMDKYFLGVKSVYTKHWKYTFPELTPVQNGTQFQDIQLDTNMYNINTMESVASAMEGSVISARNVAMMITDKWK